MSSHPKRIAIVGMPGAGKSYYAEILSKKLGIENIKLDSIFDEKPSRFFDIRSYRKEFNRLLKNRESWIVGAYHGYRMPEWFWESADLIIFIDLPKSELRKNVIGRYKSKKAAGDNTHFQASRWNIPKNLAQIHLRESALKRKLRRLQIEQPKKIVITHSWSEMNTLIKNI